jgi:3-deoxy-D-manno-octulosonic-acid transferase
VTGNLKRAFTEAVKVSQSRLKGPAETNAHPLLVAGSSHPGEEEILLDVFASLRRRFPDLRMVLAPRHPQRFGDVERLLRNRGVSFIKKSQVNGRIDFEHDVLLLDTLGDLIDFYAISDVAFVGGTLVDVGGHNLLEPARFAKPVLFGPYTANVEAIATEMKSLGGGIQVSRQEELVDELARLLEDPERRRRMGEKAYQIATNQRQVLEQSVALIGRYLLDRSATFDGTSSRPPSTYSPRL